MASHPAESLQLPSTISHPPSHTHISADRPYRRTKLHCSKHSEQSFILTVSHLTEMPLQYLHVDLRYVWPKMVSFFSMLSVCSAVPAEKSQGDGGVLFFFFCDIWPSGCADLHLLDMLSPMERKRQGYIHELIVTEENYVNDLQLVTEVTTAAWGFIRLYLEVTCSDTVFSMLLTRSAHY